MRGGSFQSREAAGGASLGGPRGAAGGAAQRAAGGKGAAHKGHSSAEALFETRPVAEVRQVERNTRKEVADKQEELRQLVGASYRDLLASADTIAAMRRDADAVKGALQRIHDGFAALSRAPGGEEDGAPEPGTPRQGRLHEERATLFAAGARVKYVVDTPERIWGCLDDGAFLRAAERLAAARTVQHAGGCEDHERFPLLAAQWPLVDAFEGRIRERARAALAAGAAPAAESAAPDAVALAALAVVDRTGSEEALETFLAARRDCLAAALGGEGDLGTVLVAAVGVVQCALAQAGELFLGGGVGGAATPPLLVAVGAGGAAEVEVFAGIPSADAEAEVWRQHRELLAKRLAPLSSEQVREASKAWLRDCTADVAAALPGLLGRVATLSELADLEGSTHAAVSAEAGCAGAAAWAASATSLTSQSASAEGGALWNGVCTLIMGDVVDVWAVFFDGCFVARAKALVSAGFEALPLRERLEPALAATTAPPRTALGGLPADTAAAAAWVDPDVAAAGPAATAPAPPAEADTDAAAAQGAAAASELAAAVDAHLKDVREQVVLVLDAAAPAQLASRAAALEPYVQQEGRAALLAAVTELERQLVTVGEELGAAEAGAAADAATERALLVGRVASALSDASTELPVLLGPPSDWLAAGGAPRKRAPGAVDAKAAALGASGAPMSAVERFRARRAAAAGKTGAAGGAAAAQLGEVQQALRRVGLEAYRVWVQRTADELVATLQQELRRDEALMSAAAPKTWEETTVKLDTMEMKLALPSLPSSYVTTLLFRAVREVYRVGGHALPPAAVAALASSLTEGALGAFSAFVGAGGAAATAPGALSEKGVLQMVFDVRFVADVLACGSPEAARAAEAGVGGRRRPPALAGGARQQPWSRDSGAVLDALTAKLDPIDWATYEPFLWGNVRKCYQRTAVLFGSFVHLHRLHAAEPKRAVFSESGGAAPALLAAAAPRFSYLPISAPSLSGPKSIKGYATGQGADVSSRDGSATGDGLRFASLKQLMSTKLGEQLETVTGTLASGNLNLLGGFLGGEGRALWEG